MVGVVERSRCGRRRMGVMARRDERAVRVMDDYGLRAMTYVREFCPSRYATIHDPVSFFSDLGDQMRQVVTDALDQLVTAPAPPDPATPEGFLDRLGRVKTARMMVEEKAFSDLVLSEFPAEQDLDDEAFEAAWEPLLPPNEEWYRDELEDSESWTSGPRAKTT